MKTYYYKNSIMLGKGYETQILNSQTKSPNPLLHSKGEHLIWSHSLELKWTEEVILAQ